MIKIMQRLPFLNSELLSSKYLTQIPSLFLNNAGTAPVYKYRCGLSMSSVILRLHKALDK